MKLGYKLRAAPTGSPHGSLLGMWRAKIQKWCSNRFSIYFSNFLNAIVTLHRWRVIVALHSLKKSYSTIFYYCFFPSLFHQSSLSPLFFFLLFSPTFSPLSSLFVWVWYGCQNWNCGGDCVGWWLLWWWLFRWWLLWEKIIILLILYREKKI